LITNESYQGDDLPVYVPSKNMEELIEEYRAKEGYKSHIEDIEYNEKCKKLSSKIGNKNAENKTKFECFKIEKPLLDKLIIKMKEKAPKAKLTSVLNAIMAICLRRLYDKYQVDDIQDIDRAQFKLTKCLRSKLNLSNIEMGSFILHMYCFFNTIGLNEENFWLEAEKLSVGLHRRMENNEEIEKYLPVIPLGTHLLNNDFNFLEHLNYEFNMSNRGALSPSESTIIRCHGHYFAQPYILPRIGSPLFNGITTINGALCWSFAFNQQLYSFEFIKSLIESLHDFIYQILKN
jgi:hypothetical protein